MKTFRNLILGFLLLASPAAFAETVEMKVNGLVCAFCAQGIEKALRKQAATEDVYVRLKDGLVAVSLKHGMTLSDETLRSLLKEAGYTVVEIARTERSLAELRGPAKP